MTADNTARKALRPVTVSSNRERPVKREVPLPRNPNRNPEAHNPDFSLSSLSHISENKSLIEFRRLNGKKSQIQDKYSTNISNAILSKDAASSSKPRRTQCKSQIKQRQNPSNNRSPKADVTKMPTQQQIEEQQRKVDALVLRNLKKNKEKQEIEQLKRLEEEEHQRQAKEMLSERNKMIREMNAKSFGRSRVLVEKKPQKKTEKKEAISVPRQPLSESERRAKLGLVFIDLQSKYFKSVHKKLMNEGKQKAKEAQKENEDHGNRTRPKKREAIREYMQQKREKIVMEQKSRKEDEMAKRKKITQNITNLQQIVSKIFSRTQEPENLVAPVANTSKSKKKRTAQQDYIRYLIYDAQHDKVQENLQLDPSSGTDDQLMDSIKQNLLSEMRRGRTEPESPAHGKTEELQAKMQGIAHRYHQLAGNNNNENAAAKSKPDSVNEDSVIKVQRYIRGYLARKKYKEMIATNEKMHENVTGENPMIEPTQEDKSNKCANVLSTQNQAAGTSPKFSEENLIFEAQNFGKLLQGSASKSQNEKVVHLSEINTLEDVKAEDKLKTIVEQKSAKREQIEEGSNEKTSLPRANVVNSVETQTDPLPVEKPKADFVKTPLKDDALAQSNSLAEMRLLLGSEELVKDITAAAQQTSEEKACGSSNKKSTPAFQHELEEGSEEGAMNGESMELAQLSGSIFGRNTFQEFTVKKLKQIAKVDNMSKLIGMREKVLKYKESTERHYIQKMYKAKRMSPKTYQSKRKELEHWVTKEKEEIKKTKRSLAETWKKVAEMIEDTNRNALQVRRILATHTLSYNSDTNSNLSLLLDSSRAATDREADDEIQIMQRFKCPETDQQKGLKHDKSLDNLSDMLQKSVGDVSASPATSKQQLSSAKGSPPEKLPKRPQNFKELYESDSDLSAGELMELADSSKKKPVTKQGNDAILIQDVNSPAIKTPSEDDEEEGDYLSNSAKKNLDLPKSASKPKEEDPVNTEEVGIGWEISLINQKPVNTRNKPEEKHSPVPAEVPPIPIVKENTNKAIINIVAEVSPDTVSSVTTGKVEEKKDDPQIADEITSFIYKKVMDELFSQPFPMRSAETSVAVMPNKSPNNNNAVSSSQPSRDVGVPTGQQMLIQSLAAARHRGIRTDGNYIGAYLDDLFVELLKTQKDGFIAEINRSIVKPALELLSNLQSTLPEHNLPSLLPHEMSPIVPLNLYLDLEKMRENTIPLAKKTGDKEPTQGFLEECEHIHDKAIFDSVNEALNLIRPYGLNGEPMPWSLQQRILFKSIADPGIIIRNIKNMVLDWSSFEVGTLPSMEFVNNGKFDEDYFAEVREKQLATLLAQEVIDNEEMWVNYESEETEVGIDLADMALEQLVVEAVKAMFTIEGARGKESVRPN